MFIAALFTIAKTRKQPKCPLTDEWSKMWYVYGILVSHKKNEIIPFAATWMDPVIKLREVSQIETNIIGYHLHVKSEKNNTNELINKTETGSQRKKINLELIKGKGKSIN